MFLADVIGTVVSPVQTPVLDGKTLLLLRPVKPSGEANGIARIGIDHTGAGVGDRVLVVDEGNAGRQLLAAPNAPVKTIVLGIVDFVELHGEHVYDERQRAPLTRNSK
ncbi:MAG: ethanolamine utilization protein EutN [Planctomycetota bacterium]|jgi:ethanolamine utilization protein EutN